MKDFNFYTQPVQPRHRQLDDVVHHHSKDARGRTVRIPHLFEVDLSGNKLIVKQ